MATIRLYDIGHSGAIEFLTNDSPNDLRAYLNSIIGTWADIPGIDGAILLTDDWWADYFIGTPDEFDPYPDYRVTSSGIELA